MTVAELEREHEVSLRRGIIAVCLCLVAILLVFIGVAIFARVSFHGFIFRYEFVINI